MNHFFALELSPDARQAVVQAARDWRELFNPQAAWLVAEDYHVTLKVLGELSETQLSHIVEAASQAALHTDPFTVSLASFGAFPDWWKPQYLWIGVDNTSKLTALADSISRLAEQEQVPLDQWPYTPHVTVAQSMVAEPSLRWPTPLERVFPTWQVSRIVLMQTLPPEQRAKDTKARYNTVHTFPFRTAHLSDVS